MKNIKEKQLLINFAKAFGQDVDESISREVTAINEIKLNAIKSIKKNSFEVLSEAFKKAKEEEKKTNLIEYPLPPSLDDVMALIEETEQEIQQVEERDIQKEAVEFISKSIKEDSYQQPVAPVTSPDISSIQKKLQFLEQWVSKISMAGQGSGEVKFKYLDDIEKNTIGNTDQILRYRPSNIAGRYGTFFFGQLSGDQGPIRSMQYDTNGYGPTANVGAGLIAWNNIEDCLNITQADGSTLQVGLENYIRVFNNTANTFSNGTFVEFRGIDTEGDAPTFRAFVNNANTIPLYNIGVLTTDVASNTHGRATVLGLVRGLNTTGNTVGEVWAPGDILWASPTYPGNYTKFKPTAPNIALSVAAVTVSHPTNGIILVRPTVWPRLQYADFYRQTGLVPSAPDIGITIPFSNTLISSGFSLSGNTIIAANSGLYKFDLRVQLTSTNSSDKSAIFWYKKNGVNIPYSAVRTSISTNGGYATLNNTQLISLTPTDNVTIHFTVTDTALLIDSPAPINGAPNIPAVQLTVIEAAL